MKRAETARFSSFAPFRDLLRLTSLRHCDFTGPYSGQDTGMAVSKCDAFRKLSAGIILDFSSALCDNEENTEY